MAATATHEPVKLTSDGNIRGAAGKLCWLVITNPGATVRIAKLNDATTGTGSEIMQIVVPKYDTKFLLFSPPMPFAVGIRVGTLETDLVLTGGFVD